MATLVTRLNDLSTRIATECKALRTLINGNAGDLTALTTTAKDNLVNAINEVKGLTGSGGAVINDAATDTTETWSSQKINDYVATQVSNLLGGAPAALDTLNEIATAINDDANFAATMTAALGNRIRFDAAQALTALQMAQACSNAGAAALADTGTLDTDFTVTFNNGLV